MKVKVIRRFRDKYTKSILEINQILEVTGERFEEINSTSHGILIEEIKEEKEIQIKEEPDKEVLEENKKKSTKK